MLVLNNLPNVQILNGRSTKDDEDDDDEEDDERESNDNENERQNLENNRNKHFFPQIEEIEEDKNMENNSNYASNENNNNSKEINIDKINGNINIIENSINYKKDNINIPKLNIGEAKNSINNEEVKPNTLLYDKIITNNSNKNLAQNNSKDNEINKKRESYNEAKNSSDNKNKSNFLIDITNEELNLLKDEKYDINSDFSTFIKEFCEVFNNMEKDEENKILNIYLNKIKEIENKRGSIPNYYYFFLLHNRKMKILKNISDEIFPYILNKCPEINKNNILIKLNNELLNSIKVSKELMSSLHLHIEEYNSKNDSKDINNTYEVIKEQNKKISSLESQRDNLSKQINEERIAYEKKISSLEKENKIMTQKLLNKANIINSPITKDKNDKLTPTNSSVKKNGYGIKLVNHRNHSQDIGKRENTNFEKYNKNKGNNKNNLNSFNKTRSPLNSFDNTLTLENNNNTTNYYINTNNNFNNSNTNKQLISLKSLKDFINELYLSKANYDMKCIEYKLPRETLEEYMYTFLNEKYGLKNLIIDWARNVINGIKYYSKKDSFVLLFGKIMRNEQEEDARLIIQKVLESIEELLLYYIKRQNPLKSIIEIKKIFERKKNSELYEEEWKGIIYSIYEKKEADEIEKKINNFISKENEKRKIEMFKQYKDSRINKKNNKYINASNNNINTSNSYNLNTINSFNSGINNANSPINLNLSYMNTINNPSNTKLTRIEKYNMLLFPDEKNILFSDFIKIVLDNHIRFRDKQLKNFVDIFKSVDTNKDGIISEEEFSELVQRMNIFKEDEIENKIFQFLEKIDPFDNQKITFSECISFFSGEIVKVKDIKGKEKEISILEKICFNGNKESNYYNEIPENESIENNINLVNNNENKDENNNGDNIKNE